MKIHPAREPCTHTVQSLHVGCSRRVHSIVYLGVKKGIFWSIYASENIHRLINPAAYLLYKTQATNGNQKCRF